MPGSTPKQRRFAATVNAVQRGVFDLSKVKSRRKRQAIRQAARSMTQQQSRDFMRKP